MRRLEAFNDEDIAYVKGLEDELRAMPPVEREARQRMLNFDKEAERLADEFGGELID